MHGISGFRAATAARVWTAALVAGATAVLATSGCTASAPAPAVAASVAPSQEASAQSAHATAPRAVRTLAKADGWREGLVTPPQVFSALEVAYDAETAQRLWDENVPATLGEVTGDPKEPGRYGDLASVDFTDQVVALWSGGQSGSCPGWAAAVTRDASGAVAVDEELTSWAPVASDGSFICSTDRRTYRTVIVVDRADLPEAAAISSTTATTGEQDFPAAVHLAAYPAG